MSEGASSGDHLLTLNAGSSSIKFALFALNALDRPALQGQVDGIGPNGRVATHELALAQVLAQLQARQERVVAVGHRIVHGGTQLVQPARIDDALVAQLQALSPLAPLHQPHNLSCVQAARQTWAGVVQVACFDTAFHASAPELNRRFALPQALFDAGVRRYGFHGLSYESILGQLMAQDPIAAKGRVVVAHLGNGASLCAMFEGRPVATTMGFSPLDGMPMGTRCGHLDPAVVLHLLQAGGKSVGEVQRLLFHESGLLGLSGLSSDMRELQASPLPSAAMAVDYFVEHLQREIAGMAAALRGIDTLIFTGGIGENAAALRERAINGLAWLGKIDVRVMCTNEEAVIARHTAALI